MRFFANNIDHLLMVIYTGYRFETERPKDASFQNVCGNLVEVSTAVRFGHLQQRKLRMYRLV
jgi:hypothetical protein